MASTMVLGFEALVSEAGESPPCGPNLEHELSFFELEAAARGKPEQRTGDAVKPAEEPKWPKVAEMAQGLLLRSKDIRLAIHLTRALTRTDGLPGLASGLKLVHGLLERYWDHVHPRLEADQGNDPTERLNALAPLIDSGAVLKDVRELYLVSSRDHGQLQVRDVEIALGRLALPRTEGAPAVKPLGQIHAQIAAAFAEDRTIPSALTEGRRHLLAIQTLVAERVGALRAIDLKPLAQCLENVLEACEAALGTRSADQPGAAGAQDAATGGPALAVSGEIRTREEAVRLLELVCGYLERREPSNPAPLFIRRAQRLMTKNFVEIVKDLMPDSLANLEKLAGEVETKK
jgi:type VI secretion system protein ImpA